MAKKRNKRYQGDDAKRERPTVRKISVDDKSKLRQWYEDHQTDIKIRGVYSLFAAVLALLIWGIFNLIF